MSTDYLYSFSFSKNVVIQFTEKYARGTDFICKMLHIPHEKFVRYLTKCVSDKKQLRWEQMKRLIKEVSENTIRDYVKLSSEDKRNWLTIMKFIIEDEILDELTLLST